MGRVAALGLDIGRKRVGVAGCDGTGLIATELTTLKRKAYPEFVADLRAIVEARQVEILVIGLPYSMDGSIGHQAQQVQKLAQRLSDSLELPIEYVDERLTSHEAELLIQANSRSRDRNQRHKGLVDRKAAAIILQQWLDQRRQTASRQDADETEGR
jgi:putative Holliday junction resolvase